MILALINTRRYFYRYWILCPLLKRKKQIYSKDLMCYGLFPGKRELPGVAGLCRQSYCFGRGTSTSRMPVMDSSRDLSLASSRTTTTTATPTDYWWLYSDHWDSQSLPISRYLRGWYLRMTAEMIGGFHRGTTFPLIINKDLDFPTTFQLFPIFVNE